MRTVQQVGSDGQTSIAASGTDSQNRQMREPAVAAVAWSSQSVSQSVRQSTRAINTSAEERTTIEACGGS